MKEIPWDELPGELMGEVPPPRGRSVEDYAEAALANAEHAIWETAFTRSIVYSNLAVAAAVRELTEAVRELRS